MLIFTYMERVNSYNESITDLYALHERILLETKEAA
jgi:hypothetical protein